MRYLLFFIVCLSLAIPAHPQDTENRVNSQGKKEGFWKKKDSTGALLYQGQFRNGIPYGSFTYFYRDGRVKATTKFSDNGRYSRTITYFNSGKKMAEGNFIDEKRDSIWRFYSDYDGVLLSEENYIAGKKDGVSKTFYAGKGPAETITWKAGVKEGPWIQYFTDGTIKMKAFYKNDQKEGPIEAFATTGKHIFTGRYANGDPDGVWMYYDDKGNPVKKEVYDNGALVSSEEIKTGK
jgi:antitoxin component YwqK of YwqJK toxin-antitoxin module